MTVTEVGPALPEIRLAGTVPVNCVELTKVVVIAVPANFTTAGEMKLAPLTVSVNGPPPLAAEPGLRDEITGAGATVKVAVAEVPPFGFTTVTLTGPALATRLVATPAVNCEELT